MSRRIHRKVEIFPHERLWRSSTALFSRLELGEEEFHEFRLPTLLSAVLAFEAFVNFCGLSVRPDLWSDERTRLKGATLEDKLCRILERVPSFSWKKGEAPYQNVARQLNFRDLVVHGKVQQRTYETDAPDASWPEIDWSHEWDPYLEVAAIKRAREDIREFAESILVALRRTSNYPHVISPAFAGPLASAEGHEIGG